MKVRGNESDAEVTNITSYFLPNKLITKVIAQKVAKNPKIVYKNLTFASSSITIVHFTIDN